MEILSNNPCTPCLPTPLSSSAVLMHYKCKNYLLQTDSPKEQLEMLNVQKREEFTASGNTAIESLKESQLEAT